MTLAPPAISASEVDRFVRVDHHDPEAIIVTVDGEMIAVGRFDRLDDPGLAEVPFLVADEHQGAGIGRALSDMLATRARTMGITRYVADVLPSDPRMLELFRRTGPTCERRFEDGVIHLGATTAPCPTPAG